MSSGEWVHGSIRLRQDEWTRFVALSVGAGANPSVSDRVRYLMTAICAVMDGHPDDDGGEIGPQLARRVYGGEA